MKYRMARIGSMCDWCETLVIGACVVVAWVASADAAERVWREESYPYTVVDQDVREALAELGRNLKVGVDISEEVEGRLHGPWTSATLEDFMDRIADDLDIEWFFDGRRLHVSSASESVRQLLPLKGIEPEAWQVSLDKLGISNDRFPIAVDSDRDTALVSGPPKYVSLIVQTLPKPKAKPAPVGRVNIIYGRNSPGDAS